MKPWTALLALALAAAPAPGALGSEAPDAPDPNVIVEPGLFEKMRFRMIGPFRGGRSGKSGSASPATARTPSTSTRTAPSRAC